MYEFTCANCGKKSYSSSHLALLRKPTCPYCGLNKLTIKNLGKEPEQEKKTAEPGLKKVLSS